MPNLYTDTGDEATAIITAHSSGRFVGGIGYMRSVPGSPNELPALTCSILSILAEDGNTLAKVWASQFTPPTCLEVLVLASPLPVADVEATVAAKEEAAATNLTENWRKPEHLIASVSLHHKDWQ